MMKKITLARGDWMKSPIVRQINITDALRARCIGLREVAS
jgi:hypothetical protein